LAVLENIVRGFAMLATKSKRPANRVQKAGVHYRGFLSLFFVARPPRRAGTLDFVLP